MTVHAQHSAQSLEVHMADYDDRILDARSGAVHCASTGLQSSAPRSQWPSTGRPLLGPHQDSPVLQSTQSNH
jgi:hypothetical protein